MKPIVPGGDRELLLFHRILDQAEDFMWAVDNQYRLIYGNALFHKHSFHILGRTVSHGECTLPPDMDAEVRNRLKDLYDRVLQHEEGFKIELNSKYLPGSQVIEYTFSPIMLEEDSYTGVLIVGRNVTERKRSEDLLARTRELLYLTQELTFMGAWEWDIRAKKMFYTPEVYRILDLEPTNSNYLGPEIIDDSISCFSPEMRGTIKTAFERCCHDAIPYDLESAFVSLKGQHRWVRTIGHPILEDGVIVRVAGHIQDITLQKKQELALQTNEMKYRTLVEQVGAMLFLHDMEGNIHEVNHTATRSTGYSREELLSMKVQDLKPVLTEYEDPLSIWKSLNLQDEYVFEARHQCKNGTVFPAEIVIRKIVLHEVEYVLALARDISQRKQVEEALLNSERQANAILEAIPDMFFRIDTQGRLLAVSGVKDNLYFQEETLIGRNVCDVMPEDFCGLLKEQMDQVVKTGIMQVFEYGMTVPGLGERDYDARIVFFKPDEIIAIVRDITDWKQSKLIIEQKNRLLEKAMAEKNRIFAIIAHDLRNPFSVFVGFTDILFTEGSRLNAEELHTVAQKMNELAKDLYNLLDNLLEWSRAESVPDALVSSAWDLRTLTSNCLKLYEQKSENKGVPCENAVPENLKVMANRYSLEVIIRNLLSNAIKYTDTGGQVRIHAKEIMNDRVEIIISDTGIGMNQEMMDALFNFSRDIRRPGTQGEMSNGLGMLLVKGLVEKMGGEIMVYSEPGRGTTVSFVIRKG